MSKRKKKAVEQICKNCRLFNPARSVCSVWVLLEGRKVQVPVGENDPCFYEQPYFDPMTGEQDTFNEIKEVRMWVEGKDGKRTDGNGTVKIEFPEGFFGELKVTDII